MSFDRELLFRLATSERAERLVRAVPRGADLAWHAASRYVAGTESADAIRTVHGLHEQGVKASIDQFGERVDDPAVAGRAADDYRRLAEELAGLPQDTWLAADLSHLGVDVDRAGCADHLTTIARALPDGRRIQVGAEDAARADAILGCVREVAEKGLADRLGATVQANLRRSPEDVDQLVDAGVHIRLVKGAFVEPMDVAWPYGEPTDIAYVRLAHQLAAAGARFSLATHDGVLREALLAALGPVEVEQVLGVRHQVATELAARDIPVRVYVPFGRNWFRYWMRRVAESRGV